MSRVKRCGKHIALGIVSARVRRKTKLSKIQSREFAETMLRTLRSPHNTDLKKMRMCSRVLLRGFDWKAFSLTEASLSRFIGTSTLLERYRAPIGAWFTIDSEADFADAPRIKNTDRITYYASGREPLLAVANLIAPERKVVLVPYFTCGTVFQPFWENGWETVFYKVGHDLRMDTQDVEAVFEQHQPSLAVFMEYSGMDLSEDELLTITRLKQKGCVIVVDRCQNIYSTRRHEAVDFYCGSLRKWYCCPDGAYLERNGSLPLPPLPKNYNDVYAMSCAAMMFVNGLAQKTRTAEYLELGAFLQTFSSSYVCCEPVRERNMSEYSKAVYRQEIAKNDQYRQKRWENYRYLHSRIVKLQSVRPVCRDLAQVTSTPFMFHIYAQNRDELSNYLARRGILTRLNWKKAPPLGQLDAQTEYIFDHIMSLCCDQRYSIPEMKYLCDQLEAYEKEHFTG